MNRIVVPPTTLRIESYVLDWMRERGVGLLIRQEWQSEYLRRGARPVVREDEVVSGNTLVHIALYLEIPLIEVILS